MKKMLNLAFNLIFIILLFSCTRVKESVDTREIVYFKDVRTNLCFAKIEFSLPNYNANGVSISCVPCDSVKHLIEK